MAKPYLRCCTPRRVPFPSGWAWAHADDCPVNPKQKVREPHRRSVWWSPQPFAGVQAEATIWRMRNGR